MRTYVYEQNGEWKIVYEGFAMEVSYESKEDAEKGLKQLFLLDSKTPKLPGLLLEA